MIGLILVIMITVYKLNSRLNLNFNFVSNSKPFFSSYYTLLLPVVPPTLQLPLFALSLRVLTFS